MGIGRLHLKNLDELQFSHNGYLIVAISKGYYQQMITYQDVNSRPICPHSSKKMNISHLKWSKWKEKFVQGILYSDMDRIQKKKIQKMMMKTLKKLVKTRVKVRNRKKTLQLQRK